MQTKEITVSEIVQDDWFFLGGRLYRVLEVQTMHGLKGPQVELAFHNPHWMPSYRHQLIMDPGFPMQILNQ